MRVRLGLGATPVAYDGCRINYRARRPGALAPTDGTGGDLDDRIRRALGRGHLIDITTTGRKSGQPRRVELVFHALDGHIYISGAPWSERRRSWIANLESNANFTFHLKGAVSADLPATARIITDEDERREVIARIIASSWHNQDLETMVAYSPLIEVSIADLAA